MNQKLITQIGKSQRIKIINALKRTQGLPVGELAARLEMSYMGVKQHCLSLHADGFLDVWRRPVPVGRPEMLYRLTVRAHELFPTTSNQTTIELLNASAKLFGASAPEKLLFLIFQQKTEGYLSRLKGETLLEKAECLARVRDVDGYMADLETEGGLRIVEHHSPMRDLVQAFPTVTRLETELFQRLLRVPVEREEKTASGLYCSIFHIAAG
jgi:predicted ArsR family transcriptional regulator